jgi:hypothetical protein
MIPSVGDDAPRDLQFRAGHGASVANHAACFAAKRDPV